MTRTFVDRGGTFTDVVRLHDDGRADIAKVPSDQAVVGELAEGPLTFGTTVATNALLERKGVRTLLVVTAGFEDLPWIGDQARPALFDPDAEWPPPLCRQVVGVPGRIDGAGAEIEALDLTPLDGLDASSFDAVAVVLLNSYASSSHELAVAARFPGHFVSLGHRMSAEVGYLARIETTLVDAAITPVLEAALTRDRIPPDARAMRSDGSLCPGRSLRAPDAVLSGPAGGVLAVAAVAEQAGFASAVGLDMGGTSTDICRVDVGSLPRREGEVRVAGVRLRRPMFEVETIAAGGGSVLATDGLRLTVGPESAGADPGPACYGRGGPPTLTDAALLAGLVDPDAFQPPLRADLVRLPGDASPQEFLGIAREAMAQAVRRLATSRGVDVTDHALIAYGGAAGQHAAAVAERLGITTVLLHPCASVLCAWGQALAREEEFDIRPIWRPLAGAWDEVQAAFDTMVAELPALGEVARAVELRYQGTDHGLVVPCAPDDGPEAVARAFREAHRQRYGFDRRAGVVEVANAQVRVRATRSETPRVDADPWSIGDAEIAGPAVVTSATTSVEIPRGWRARLQEGLLRLEAVDPRRATDTETDRTPYRVELWSNRFQAVAEDGGTVLRRLARSVNIRERLDFSVAVFDPEGRLVANAPHIPVHLGAMGETVRDLIASTPDLADGQAYLSNDPSAGGSHLPDLTVVTPVRHGDRRFFVASRGHHVDVGGLTPGSMPPRSRTLADEGFVVRHAPLLDGKELRDLAPLMPGCRQPATVVADLEAQIAANAHTARLLRALGPPEVIAAWMAHLTDVADEAVAAVIGRLPAQASAEDAIDGVPLRVGLEVKDGRLRVDLRGTGGPHPGNLNAPRAVVRAAVLYALRVLVGREIPLNEGSLRRVDLAVPSPSIVDPPAESAVVGGNVETSQRLVDLVLRAAGARAASQGTMNNLTVGGEGWSVYETIGGGTGASPERDGASARQVHMTNTRSTDPEVLEARLPLRVVRFGVRRGSGGDGRRRGGDGVVRELELLAPASAALLATRRDRGAPGSRGGRDGAPGLDELRREGRWSTWDGDSVDLAVGDRVRVSTPGGGGWGEADPDDTEPDDRSGDP